MLTTENVAGKTVRKQKKKKDYLEKSDEDISCGKSHEDCSSVEGGVQKDKDDEIDCVHDDIDDEENSDRYEEDDDNEDDSVGDVSLISDSDWIWYPLLRFKTKNHSDLK